MTGARESALLALLGGRDPQQAEAADLRADAWRHGLSAWVLAESAARGWQPPGQVELARDAQALTVQALRVRGCLLDVLDALAAEGAVPLLLKGPDLAARTWPRGVARPTSDVDLMLGGADRAAWNRARRRLGLTPVIEHRLPYPPAFAHHDVWAGPRGQVEVHRRLVVAWGIPWGEADATCARAVAGVCEGRPVRRLPPEHELLFLALHAANHLASRLSWLLDLRYWLARHPDVDWPALAASAHAAGLARPAWLAFGWAARVVQAPVPDSALLALQPAPGVFRRAAARLDGSRLLRPRSGPSHTALWKAALAPNKARWVGYLARRAWYVACLHAGRTARA